MRNTNAAAAAMPSPACLPGWSTDYGDVKNCPPHRFIQIDTWRCVRHTHSIWVHHRVLLGEWWWWWVVHRVCWWTLDRQAITLSKKSSIWISILEVARLILCFVLCWLEKLGQPHQRSSPIARNIVTSYRAWIGITQTQWMMMMIVVMGWASNTLKGVRGDHS